MGQILWHSFYVVHWEWRSRVVEPRLWKTLNYTSLPMIFSLIGFLSWWRSVFKKCLRGAGVCPRHLLLHRGLNAGTPWGCLRRTTDWDTSGRTPNTLTAGRRSLLLLAMIRTHVHTHTQTYNSWVDKTTWCLQENYESLSRACGWWPSAYTKCVRADAVVTSLPSYTFEWPLYVNTK